jgi:hypothetical protein
MKSLYYVPLVMWFALIALAIIATRFKQTSLGRFFRRNQKRLTLLSIFLMLTWITMGVLVGLFGQGFQS